MITKQKAPAALASDPGEGPASTACAAQNSLADGGEV